MTKPDTVTSVGCVMSQTITLEVSDALMESAQAVARQTSRRVQDVLTEWLARAAAELPLEALPDEQILALRDAQFPADQQAELRDLLADQREGQLTPDARTRLDQLMGLYEQGLLAKARALQEAVARGLQPPISQH
jgi:hypothetical protein